MKVIKFEAIVSEDGTIHIPENISLEMNETVDVIIMPRKDTRIIGKTASDFIKRWKGTLNLNEVSDLKLEYLLNKYR